MQSQTASVANGIIIDRAPGQSVIYCGFSLRETAGATALVRIRVNTITGKILDTIPLAANEGASDYYVDGVYCDGDLYCEIASGTVEGTIRHG